MSIDRMNTSAVALPARVGQATAVEQSRAVAEVQAAVVVAQQCPRKVQSAIAEMRQSCGQKSLAERAFYRYKRGTSPVSGATIHLARDLARCWGNIQYGIIELSRDDDHGQSEMQAWAWDVQTNTRLSNTFIVPHVRDKTDGPVKLVDLRDIYENNTNNASRRVRECIFAILPPWFVEEAKDLCTKALANGGGKPLAQRIADAIKVFEGIGIRLDQIEQKLDRESSKWTDHDVAQLAIILKSIQRGEVTKDEEFPPVRVTGAEIAQAAADSKATATEVPFVDPSPVAAPPSDADDESWPPAAKPGTGRRTRGGDSS